VKHFIFVLLACSFSFGLALAAPPYHPPAHAPARPPVVVRPPTLPSQIILEQRRARDTVERRREEDIPVSSQENEEFWIEATSRPDKELIEIFGDLTHSVSGLDDETRENARQRVLADLDSHNLPPMRDAQIRREVEQKFESDANMTSYYEVRFLKEVTWRFRSNLANEPVRNETVITNALTDAIRDANHKLQGELTNGMDRDVPMYGISLDTHIDRSFDEGAGLSSVSSIVQALRDGVAYKGAPEAQVARVTPTSVTPVPVPETPVVEVPAPPVAPENRKPIAINTPTLRETVAPSPRIGTENTQPLASSRPTVRETVVLTPPETPTYDILTPVPAYTPTDSHSTPTTTVPIRTASVPSSRERPSMPQINSSAVRSGPSFVGSVAALVGPAIKNGLVTVANWMDDHKLLGRDYEREGHSDFHGIGTGAFEGRLGYSMTPTSVVKGGIVRGSNIGGGLVL